MRRHPEGGRLIGPGVRRPAGLSAPAPAGRWRIAVLGLLALDGVCSAVMAVFFLPLRIGEVPFPISAVAAGALNTALVWAALQVTSSARVAALPLWTWLAVVAGFTFGGPGDDVVFGGTGLMEYAAVLLIAVGAAPPAWLVVRRTTTPA